MVMKAAPVPINFLPGAAGIGQWKPAWLSLDF